VSLISGSVIIFRLMNKDQKFYEAFKKHLPEGAVNYCFDLWKADPFNFYITRERQTKLGDFRYRSDQKVQTITINHNLNPYQFLITYVHEVAHYRAFTKYGTKIKPHGIEWKRAFQELLYPLLDPQIFPRDILIPLKRYIINPKASTGADPWLMMELRKFDENNGNTGLQFLQQIKVGSQFEIKGRIFEKLEVKRTRVLCLEIDSGRKFLISGHAEVKLKKD
jgi:hypothetical protein